jgi:hypothetical protein
MNLPIPKDLLIALLVVLFDLIFDGSAPLPSTLRCPESSAGSTWRLDGDGWYHGPVTASIPS